MKKVSQEYFKKVFYSQEALVYGLVCFSDSNWPGKYSKESRTYVFTSDNKFWKGWCGGSSLFACNLDGSERWADIRSIMGFKKDYVALLTHSEFDKLLESAVATNKLVG